MPCRPTNQLIDRPMREISCFHINIYGKMSLKCRRNAKLGRSALALQKTLFYCVIFCIHSDSMWQTFTKVMFWLARTTSIVSSHSCRNSHLVLLVCFCRKDLRCCDKFRTRSTINSWLVRIWNVQVRAKH